MLRGLSAAAAAMLPRIRRQEVSAHNLANASTAGFKRDLVFEQLLDRAQSTRPGESAVQTGLAIDFTPGTMEETGNALDLAIEGDGFFVVETDSGERYTRNGHFTVSADGVLTTPEGNTVQGKTGEIQLPPGTVTIATDGGISVDGLNVGALRLVRFDDTSVLSRSSGSLFTIRDPVRQPEEDSSSLLRQGYLEQSNVAPVDEMVNMIDIVRGFEAVQKSILVQDESLGRAINELGRVRS
ncbi:MAG: flagellar basal-body rod protein FlgF [Candidatus Zixiibacteriota bacterium]